MNIAITITPVIQCMDCGQEQGQCAPVGVSLEEWKCGACGSPLGVWVGCEACGRVEENLPLVKIRRPVRHLVRLMATECPDGHLLHMRLKKL